MFLRHTKRKKDGKEHRYWSIVENRRIGGGRVVQRPLLYLGEINDSQELAWRKSIAILEEGALQPRTLSLFPEDRCEGLLPDASIVRLRLNELRLCRPRQWGGCWLALSLWRELELDCFWGGRLPPSRKGTRWDRVLLLLATYRLLAPGSEWRLHRDSQGIEGQRDGVGFSDGARHSSDPSRNEDVDADDIGRQYRLDADPRHARQCRADAGVIAGELVGPSLRIGVDGSRERGCHPLAGLREQPLARDRGEVAAGRVLEQIERCLADELGLSRVRLEGERPGFLREQQPLAPGMDSQLVP